MIEFIIALGIGYFIGCIVQMWVNIILKAHNDKKIIHGTMKMILSDDEDGTMYSVSINDSDVSKMLTGDKVLLNLIRED